MLRSSEIKPLFVDLSLCDKSFFFTFFFARGLLLRPLATSAVHVTFTSPTVLPHHSRLVVNRPIEGKRCAFFFWYFFHTWSTISGPRKLRVSYFALQPYSFGCATDWRMSKSLLDESRIFLKKKFFYTWSTISGNREVRLSYFLHVSALQQYYLRNTNAWWTSQLVGLRSTAFFKKISFSRGLLLGPLGTPYLLFSYLNLNFNPLPTLYFMFQSCFDTFRYIFIKLVHTFAVLWSI